MGNESTADGVIDPDELREDDGNPPTPPYGGSVPRPASYNSAGSFEASAGGSAGSGGSYSLGPTGVKRPRSDALVGQTLDGRFKILRLVARGGMGRIYEAEQLPLGRRVALKVMDLTYAEELDPDFQKRFFLEASTCAQLSHPNTIRVFDYGNSDEETFYIAMEFIAGQTLLKIINEQAPLAPLRVIHVARQICGSLSEAHAQGVIHRDLKPSNVLLTQHGETADYVKVLDFGLVKLIREGEADITKSGLFLGSPNYMSPEQIRSNAVDQRSDIYSLGVLLYMCLTGRAPFQRDTSVKVLLAQLEDEPPPFSETLAPGQVPDALEWLVRTCLAKKAEERFASVDEMNRALRAIELEVLGQSEGPVELSLDAFGRVLLPEGMDLATASLRWTGSQPSSDHPPIAPVSSSGSLLSARPRREDPTPPPASETPAAAPASGESSSRPRRSKVQRKPAPTKAETLVAAPWFAALLGAAALGLLILLVFLLRSVLAPSEPQPGGEEPEVPSFSSPGGDRGSADGADGSLPPDVPVPDLPVPDLPAPQATSPAPARAESLAPAAATNARGSRPAADRSPNRAPSAAASSPGDSTEPPASGQNAPDGEREGAEPAKSPEPARKRAGSDLRDPWSE